MGFSASKQCWRTRLIEGRRTRSRICKVWCGYNWVWSTQDGDPRSRYAAGGGGDGIKRRTM